MTKDTHPVSGMDFGNIPNTLRARNQWMFWKWEKRVNPTTGEIKWTKPPYQADGSLSGSDDPRKWTSFNNAVAVFIRSEFDGIGYALTVDREPTDELPGTTDDGLAGVDLDHVVDSETDTITAWAQDIVDRLDSYTEISPSGTGLRIFLFAKLPPQYRRHARLGFECYEDGRYLTVTGNHLAGTPRTIESRQDEMTAVHAEVFADRNRPRPASSPQPNAQPVDLDDAALLEIAFAARNGDKVRRLYEGDFGIHGSHSEADLALCNHLAFYTGPDMAKIDRLFRASDLMRPKWDESRGAQTYGENTITFAIEGTTEFYSPDRRRNVGGGCSECISMTTPQAVKYEPSRDGWQFQIDDVLFVAQAPHVDRGNIRTALTVSKSEAALWTQNVNLTSAISRQTFIKALAERGVTVLEGYLIGLEQVCRQKPQVRGGVVTPSNISATVDPVDWAEMESTFDKWLLLEDKGVLRILFGAYLSHLLGGDPVWLFLIAPPGGAKTELLSSFYSAPKVYPISELTAKTFASGLDTPHGDPSLLARLSDEVLILKDFTTILEMNRDERQAILAQLREIYDGRFDKAWGTGKELHWRGRLGFLAGVTPVIDRHQAVLSVLGERFVQLRIKQPDREKVADAAMNSVGLESPMREGLSNAVAGCLAKIGTPIAPTVPAGIRKRLAKLANFTTRARSGVIRDGYRRNLDYAPEPEAPTRFVRQLFSLARGIAATRGAQEVGSEDLALVQRVALDCIPAQRRVVLSALVEGETDETLSTSTMAEKGQYSTDTIRRALEDCQALGLVSVDKGGPRNADMWSMLGDWKATFAEMSEGGTTPIPSEEVSPNGKVDAAIEDEVRV